MKRYFYLLTITSFAVLAAAGQLSAQEAVNGEVETISVGADSAALPVPATDMAEDVNYSYGTVISITGDQLAVLEYDYDKDAEIEVTYQVPSTAEFNNIPSLAELKKDDNIEIYYKEVDGKKVAEIIALEILTPEGEVEEEGIEGASDETLEAPVDVLPEGEAVVPPADTVPAPVAQ